MIDTLKIFENTTCKLCDFPIKNRRSLGNHLARSHKGYTTYDYILKFIYQDIIPKCACGCKQHVLWHKLLYKFNEFLMGHNSKFTGFSAENQPDWTVEQIKNRNKAIQKAYTERGDEIKEKISEAVNKAYESTELRTQLSNIQKKIWRNPIYKEKMKKVRKRVWVEQYDELYEKIFTPEMRKKIAQANMKRDAKRSSKEEDNFISFLQNTLKEHVVPSFWWNGTDAVKCFDAFIPEHKLLIEFDGIYHHGLDRSEHFDIHQLSNMTNDFSKNRLAYEEINCDLIRIRSDVDYSSIESVDDLKALAYHYQQSDGKIIRDGMFKFRDEEHAIISRDQLIQWHVFEKDIKGREWVEKNVLCIVLDFFRTYVTHHGWFYPEAKEKDNLSSVVKKLQEKERDMHANEISSMSSIGNIWLKSVFKSFWEVKDGPVESFWNDTCLKNVLKYRLGLNNSKDYNYETKEGVKVSCNEMFNINIKSVRFGFIVQRRSVSWFKPDTYYYLLERYLGNTQNPKIWDPSCGFGARMLAFYAYAKDKGGTYIGTDPSSAVFRDLCILRDIIKHNDNECNVDFDLFMCGSEEIKLPNESIDFIATSPPYFDKEKYINENSQCWKRYPDKNNWINFYLQPTFETAYKALHSNKYMIINIDKENRDIVVSTALDVGFTLENELKLMLTRNHFNKKQGYTKSNYEPILVFKK